MKPATKNILVGVALVMGIGLSIYMYTRPGAKGGEPQIDPSIASNVQSYTCTSCGHQFPITVADATHMRRTRGDVFCPQCGQGGAAKNDVKVMLSGGDLLLDASQDNEREEEEEPSAEPEKPKPPTATRQPRKRP